MAAINYYGGSQYVDSDDLAPVQKSQIFKIAYNTKISRTPTRHPHL